MPKTGLRFDDPEAKADRFKIERLAGVVDRLEAEIRGRLDAERAWASERDLLRAMLVQAPDFQYVKDTNCRFVAVNQVVATFHGMTDPAEMIGKTDFDIDSKEHATLLFAAEQEILRTGQPVIDFEEYYVGGDGKGGWYATSKVPLRDRQGDIIGIAGVTRDITARKQADLLRQAQTHIFEMIAMNAPLGDVLDRLVLLMEGQLVGAVGAVLLANEQETLLRLGAGPSVPPAYATTISEFSISPGAGCCGAAAFQRQTIIVTDIATDPLTASHRELSAKYGRRSCWSTPILSHQGNVLGTLAIHRSELGAPNAGEIRLAETTTRLAAIAIERKRAEARIHFLAHHDALTGLPNRSLLKDRLAEAMRQTDAHNPWVAVVFVDLDNFKTVNDSLGHTAGDKLLKVVADRMAICVGRNDTVVRLGGDEFVLLLAAQPADRAPIAQVLTKLAAAVAEPVPIEGMSFHVSCSMGVAIYPLDGSDPETLLLHADSAMYQAKDAGRATFRFYEQQIA